MYWVWKKLMSKGSIANDKNIIIFSKSHCWIFGKFSHNVVGYLDLSNGLHSFGHYLQTNMVYTHDTMYNTLWHIQYGHLSYHGLYHLSHIVRIIGLPHIPSQMHVCKYCLARQQY